MLQYRDGDADAFDLLYARHKGALFRYCLRHCRQRSIAEETFQDVWMRVIGARQRYQAAGEVHDLVVPHRPQSRDRWIPLG